MRPIQIYLDSSDFSDFSNLENKALAYSDVRDYLLKRRDEGLIELRFSEAHVIEAAPTSPTAIAPALARFRVIKELCAKSALLHPIDLIASEVGSASSLNSSIDVLREDGTWLPKFFDFSEILPDVEQLAVQELQSKGRDERRKYLKNGRLTPRWYAEMRQANTLRSMVLTHDLPLTKTAICKVQSYFLGEASRGDALKALHASITDLEELGNWYAKDWPNASALSERLRNVGAEFEDALMNARTQFDNLIQGQTEAGTDSKTASSQFMQSFYEVIEGSGDRLAIKLAEQNGIVATPAIDRVQASPGLTCAINLAMHIARRSIASTPPRTPKRSDFGDCYHAVYLPYVDIFRADGFMAGVLRESKLPFSTIIVDKLLNLPSKIEELLEASGLRTAPTGR